MTQRAVQAPVDATPAAATRLFGKITMPGALRVAAFRKIWVALLLIHLSRWIEITAIGWVIVEATGSPFLVSLAVFARLAPFIVAAPIGGALADRVNRMWFVRVTTLGRVSVAVVLAAGLSALGSNLLMIYVLTAIGGLFASAVIPALRVLYTGIVPDRELTSALGFEALAFTISLIAGPLIAGALLPFVDPAYMFVATTVAYSLAFATLLSVPSSTADLPDAVANDPTARPGLWGSINEGIQLARSRPAILAVFAVIVSAEGFAFTYLHLIPIFATEVLGGGPGTLGALWSAQGAGELFGSVLIVAWLGRRIHSPGRALLIAVAFSMVIGVPLGLSSSLPLALFLLFSLGSSASVFGIMQSNVILAATPPKLRGRLIGIQTMFIVTFPVGAIVVGAVASVVGPHAAVAGMSAAGLVLLGVVALKFPQLRERPASASTAL